MQHDIVHLTSNNPHYPPALSTYLGDRMPKNIAALGDLDLLQREPLALFCSVKCPGHLILQTYDLAQALREAGVPVIGGFHSPVERECLTVLLRGTSPIVVCPARGLEGMRIAAEYSRPLDEGRLLFVSPFAGKQRRATAVSALYRNQVVAALAGRIFVAYAEPTGKTEQFCRDVLAWRKPLYTFADDANANLIALGAQPLCPEEVVAACR